MTQAVYSNGTWGRVIGVMNDNDEFIPRPTGATRTETYTYENPQIELTCPDPTFEPLTISLPTKVFTKEVPDVDSRWLALQEAGELPSLDDVPKPNGVLLTELRDKQLSALDEAFAEWTSAGWDTGLDLVIPLDWNDPLFQELNAEASANERLVSQGIRSLDDLILVRGIGNTYKEVTIALFLAKAVELTAVRQAANDKLKADKKAVSEMTLEQLLTLEQEANGTTESDPES